MRGRKPSPDSLVFKTVGLSADQWAWLEKWSPGASPTHQLRDLVERSQKFWPGGPFVFVKGRSSADSGCSESATVVPRKMVFGGQTT